MLLIHAGAHAQTTYYHNDPAGTPVAASDQAGNLLWRETYRPYGDRISKPTTAASNAIWFHGKPSDSASPLLNFGARNYDPILGRFVSIDPVDFDEANLHSFNRYAYSNNNPLKYKDPDGRLPDPISLAFAAHDAGPFVGAFLAWGHGVITNNPHLVSAGLEGMSETKSGLAFAALAFAALAVVTLPGASVAARGVGKYEVGAYDALKRRSVPAGDGLDIHHAMQKNPAGQAVGGYNPANGPSIAIPRGEHLRIPTIKGEYTGTARDLLAKDIRDLRNNTNAPNSSLRELIDLNKQTYPGAFGK
ncbi:RHS repeat domain-containing protein [Leptothrix ochracea]|uniref:RHS repeat domain-containing protein n=1 Tax=Leptothrix ochracea TaxID=735331 RepID=UPI0034E2EA98